MNGKKLFEEIGNIDDKILESALKQKSFRQIINLHWKKAAASAAGIAVVLTAILFLPSIYLDVFNANNSSGQDEASLNSNISKSDEYVSEVQNSDYSSRGEVSDVESDMSDVPNIGNFLPNTVSNQEILTSKPSVTSSEPEEEIEIYIPKIINEIPTNWLKTDESKRSDGVMQVHYRDNYGNLFIFDMETGKLIAYNRLCDDINSDDTAKTYIDWNKTPYYKSLAEEYLKGFIPNAQYIVNESHISDRDTTYRYSCYRQINGFRSSEQALILYDINGNLKLLYLFYPNLYDSYKIPKFNVDDIIAKLKEQHKVSLNKSDIDDIHLYINEDEKLSVKVKYKINETEVDEKIVLFDIEKIK